MSSHVRAATPSWTAEHGAAVRLARQGDPAAALVTLKRLRRDHPNDAGVARDLIVVSVWAGQDAEAIGFFRALPAGPQPDYVIEAVGLAHRHLRQPDEALVVYRRGLRQSPRHADFTAGEIRSLVELGRIDTAIAVAETDLRARGDRLEVLLAAGFAATAQKKPVEALRYADRAVKLAPGNREVRHDRIRAIDDMGAPQVARRLADENPGVMSEAELRHIDANVAAGLVRWGVLEPPNETERFAMTDRAIAMLDGLIARWSPTGGATSADVLRVRFDRMVALRDRVRMADVLAEYEELLRQGVTMPNYAQVAAADAYLYYRQPEKARDLYIRGLEADPRNPEIQLALFYAYLDIDDFGTTYRYVDAMAEDDPIWIYLKGLKDPVANPFRATAELAAANARLYGDELAEAHRRVARIAEAAPNNWRYRSALANVYAARGWPRRAAEEYDISRAIDPRNVTTEVGQARSMLDLRSYREVEARSADLVRRFPENLEAQRLARLWRVHNMAELRVSAERAIRSATNVQGGSGLAIDAVLHSPPLDYNWRLFAGLYAAHEKLTEAEGSITLRRSSIGLEYRGGDLLASLEGTMSAFGSDSRDTLTSGVGEGRAGLRGLATWSIDDHWQLGGSAEIFARDTPLRALRNGVTANAGSASLEYRHSESRAVTLTGRAMDFSDGNLRTGLAGQHTERLVTQPRFTMDGILGLAGSQNTSDANRPYFNPSRDGLASYGLSMTQPIYRRYEFVYQHHLTVTPGIYWQQGFATGPVGSVFYEQTIRHDDVVEAGLGLSFGRQRYDGAYENSAAVLFNLRLRF